MSATLARHNVVPTFTPATLAPQNVVPTFTSTTLARPNVVPTFTPATLALQNVAATFTPTAAPFASGMGKFGPSAPVALRISALLTDQILAGLAFSTLFAQKLIAMPHDSTACPTCSARAGDSMSDAEFGAFLDQCRLELKTKQAFVMERAAGQSYHFDLESDLMTLGTDQFSISVIGSFCPSRSTWLWGWANDTFSVRVRERASKFKVLYTATGFRVFVNEGIRATKRDAEDFAAMAVHALDAFGFWRVISDDLELYLCLETGPLHDGIH